MSFHVFVFLQSLEKEPRFITLQFSTKNGRGKPIGGSFIGTSPEFEVCSLYGSRRMSYAYS